MSTPRPPLPPFDAASARQKVLAAEAAWNSRDPERVSLAYTVDSVWRNRSEFLQGREVKARPLNRTQRLWQLVRREPRLSGLVSLLGR